jgi:hypothetical protein
MNIKSGSPATEDTSSRFRIGQKLRGVGWLRFEPASLCW